MQATDSLTLRKARVKVVDHTGEVHDNVQIDAAGGRAMVRKARTPILDRMDVLSIERVPPFRGKYHWLVTFTDTAVWQVEQRNGCGCGR